MFDKFCNRFLPVYIRFWPTKYWLAIWSAPNKSANETAWQALRITVVRYGEHHSRLIYTIKQGVV